MDYLCQQLMDWTAPWAMLSQLIIAYHHQVAVLPSCFVAWWIHDASCSMYSEGQTRRKRCSKYRSWCLLCSRHGSVTSQSLSFSSSMSILQMHGPWLCTSSSLRNEEGTRGGSENTGNEVEEGIFTTRKDDFHKMLDERRQKSDRLPSPLFRKMTDVTQWSARKKSSPKDTRQAFQKCDAVSFIKGDLQGRDSDGLSLRAHFAATKVIDTQYSRALLIMVIVWNVTTDKEWPTSPLTKFPPNEGRIARSHSSIQQKKVRNVKHLMARVHVLGWPGCMDGLNTIVGRQASAHTNVDLCVTLTHTHIHIILKHVCYFSKALYYLSQTANKPMHQVLRSGRSTGLSVCLCVCVCVCAHVCECVHVAH